MSVGTIAAVGTGAILLLLVTRPAPLGAQGNANVKEDSAFIREAALAGLAEVSLGKLAHDKATSRDVKDLGQLMETDHSKINQDLDAIITAGGLSVRSRLAREDQQAYDQLTKKSGEEFDAAYLAMIVNHHVEEIQEFRDQQASAKSQAVRDFTKKTLPILQKHLDEAKQLAGGPK